MKKLKFILFISMLTINSLAQQIPDDSFNFEVLNPEYNKGTGPVIIVDEAHNNFLTLDDGDFLASEEKIATNILADRLTILEKAGLVKCKRDKVNKSRYNYSLTEKGLDLIPVMLEIMGWSAKHDKKTAAPKEFAHRIKNDREHLIEEIISHLKSSSLITSS